MLDAGVYGAEEGDRVGKANSLLSLAPDFETILLPLDLGIRLTSFDGLIDIENYIGSGLMAAEAVPAVFGIGRCRWRLESIFGGVNIDMTQTQ